MILKYLNSPSLDMDSDIASEFKTTMANIGLTKAISGPVQSNGYTLDLVYVSSEWWHGFVWGELTIIHLPWTDHILITLGCFGVASSYMTYSVRLFKNLMDQFGFQREFGVVPEDLVQSSNEASTSCSLLSAFWYHQSSYISEPP